LLRRRGRTNAAAVAAASTTTAISRLLHGRPGTPDYDAVVLLDMAGAADASAVPEGSSHDSGLSRPR